MEQVAEAALDVKALNLAFTIVQEIREKFPTAQRTDRITVRLLQLTLGPSFIRTDTSCPEVLGWYSLQPSHVYLLVPENAAFYSCRQADKPVSWLE